MPTMADPISNKPKHTNKHAVVKHEEAETPTISTSKPSSITSFFTCKHYQTTTTTTRPKTTAKTKKNGCSGSICKLRDMQTTPPAQNHHEHSKRSRASGGSGGERRNKKPLSEINTNTKLVSLHSNSNKVNAPSTSSSSTCSGSVMSGSLRVMQLRRLSGCHECHNGSVIDPLMMMRASICACNQCGEVFIKAESLEMHKAVRHAVSTLSPEDSSRSIVEIIFQSSWLKKQEPPCKIDRILKVHNIQRTITKFEDYRDSIKGKANRLARKHPRCNADGNELLRFHSTTLRCSLGSNGATNLCDAFPRCNLCSIIRDGFRADSRGRIGTMGTSGRAHDVAKVLLGDGNEEWRAMVVCRVIAGKVKRSEEASEECDSVAGSENLDELFVFSPRAILPCFIVIYQG